MERIINRKNKTEEVGKRKIKAKGRNTLRSLILSFINNRT
jgi:hypothetical protein